MLNMYCPDPARSKIAIDALIDEVILVTGRSEFSAPEIVPGLRVLIDSLNREAGLNDAGLEAQRHGLVNTLCNRLRLDGLFRRRPEILAEKIRGPIIIVGLPRSGTTKLQRVMAEDPGLQKLPLWKILNPAPLAGDGESAVNDPRIDIAKAVVQAMRDNAPDFFAGHPMDAMAADEEVFMADLVMRGWNPCYSAKVPGFENWLEQQDFSPWYRYLGKLLRMFQWQDGSPQKPWLLKTCEHLPYLHELFAAFPEATVVHCHRDPLSTIPSLGALTAASWKMYADDIDDREAARFVLRHMEKQMKGYMAQRPVLEKRHRFVDVGYSEIVNDIHGVIERIYFAAGVELSPEARKAMAAWEAGNPIAKHGRHEYSLEKLGLRENEIRAAFADYLERFGGLMQGG